MEGQARLTPGDSIGFCVSSQLRQRRLRSVSCAVGERPHYASRFATTSCEKSRC